MCGLVGLVALCACGCYATCQHGPPAQDEETGRYGAALSKFKAIDLPEPGANGMKESTAEHYLGLLKLKLISLI